MQFIHVDDQLVDLHAVEQGKLGSFANISIDMCAIIDRCVPNHCEHGGKCTQTWDSFSCTCDGTGYSGATCHNSIYELSCEAYKHLGKTTGSYWIDPDGSGALGPLKVYCDMTALEVLNNDIRRDERIAGVTIKREAYNLEAFADDLVMILLEDPLEGIRTLIEKLKDLGVLAVFED
ncbi:contactin-associated protein-like 2 [Python bivittatus]|uniref:Contactin-associated protein-like 2 n=1 Tax=Python bivittatus TaxID=176946 RepID=A0A9F5IXV8_PYTBI|nr:contactin-associated protein-like 2 [Python bivittatus]